MSSVVFHDDEDGEFEVDSGAEEVVLPKVQHKEEAVAQSDTEDDFLDVEFDNSSNASSTYSGAEDRLKSVPAAPMNKSGMTAPKIKWTARPTESFYDTTDVRPSSQRKSSAGLNFNELDADLYGLRRSGRPRHAPSRFEVE